MLNLNEDRAHFSYSQLSAMLTCPHKYFLQYINPEKEKKLLHLMFKVNEAMEKECFYPNPRSSFGCGGCCYALSCEYAF